MEAYDKKRFVPKDLHDRQVEVLQNIIGSMLRMAGQEAFVSHVKELDSFGARFEVATEMRPDGRLVIATRPRGVLPARAMPTVPMGQLKRFN